MALDVQVRVTCPDDEESKDELVHAVLRITESELVLWYPWKAKQSEFWMRRPFRPFRGPWLIQFLLTVFFAPTILFGKRDVCWIRHNEEKPQPHLRITPFVPAEFWVDIHFASVNDSELVVNAMELLWNPQSAKDRQISYVFLFIKKWWRLSGIAVFLFAMVAISVPSAGLSLVGFAGFFVYIVAIMLVETIADQHDHPPQQNRSTQ